MTWDSAREVKATIARIIGLPHKQCPTHECDPDRICLSCWEREVTALLDRARADERADEREACIKIAEGRIEEPVGLPCPDEIPGCLVYHHRTERRRLRAYEIVTALRARR